MEVTFRGTLFRMAVPTKVHGFRIDVVETVTPASIPRYVESRPLGVSNSVLEVNVEFLRVEKVVQPSARLVYQSVEAPKDLADLLHCNYVWWSKFAV